MVEPPAERRRIRMRANELISEQMSLKGLRKAEGITQTGMAGLLGVGQDSVSRLENRGDMRLSTLQGYVAALGGALEVVARFPGRPAIVISGPEPKAKRG
ncbi:MAG: helix-turn-helix domain-containing protein [Rhodospirillales bacterium]